MPFRQQVDILNKNPFNSLAWVSGIIFIGIDLLTK